MPAAFYSMNTDRSDRNTIVTDCHRPAGEPLCKIALSCNVDHRIMNIPP
jgi:hypothetical protein